MYFSLEVCPRDDCGTLRGLNEKERELEGGGGRKREWEDKRARRGGT